MAAQRTHVALVHHRHHVARNWCHYGIGACAQVEVEHVTAEFVFVSCVSVKMSSEPKPDFDRSGACFLAGEERYSPGICDAFAGRCA